MELKDKSLQKKQNENIYKRLCKFELIKNKVNNSRNRLKPVVKKTNSVNYFYVYNPDIDFQTTIFNEQFKLFKDNLREYKDIINKSNYINVFKSIPLSSKIKCNISIEETSSILYCFPKILLGEYYNLMPRIIEIEIPNPHLFKQKYIYNEIENVSNNNKLLFHIYNYFIKSFEFYLEISKKEELKNNYLKEKEYYQVLNYFNKIRSNILYLIHSFNNSEQIYIKDLMAINQMIKDKNENYNDLNEELSKEMIKDLKEEEKKININKNIDVIEKIGQQFFFGRNKKLKIHRINSALDIKKEEKPIFDYLGNIRKLKKIKYKSIFNNKNFDTILLHCSQDIKNKILTQKINNEIKSAKLKKGYQALKINYS